MNLDIFYMFIRSILRVQNSRLELFHNKLTSVIHAYELALMSSSKGEILITVPDRINREDALSWPEFDMSECYELAMRESSMIDKKSLFHIIHTTHNCDIYYNVFIDFECGWRILIDFDDIASSITRSHFELLYHKWISLSDCRLTNGGSINGAYYGCPWDVYLTRKIRSLSIRGLRDPIFNDIYPIAYDLGDSPLKISMLFKGLSNSLNNKYYNGLLSKDGGLLLSNILKKTDFSVMDWLRI